MKFEWLRNKLNSLLPFNLPFDHHNLSHFHLLMFAQISISKEYLVFVN